MLRWWTTFRYVQSWIRRDRHLVGLRASCCVHLINLYNAHRILGLPPFWPVLRVRPAGIAHSVTLRTGTSDFNVFSQIFGVREYAVFDHLAIDTIVDCGAYVGYSAVYFLNAHPHARLIALEPDPANAEMCRRNLRAYGDRAEVLEAALWSHPSSLAVTRGNYRDGAAWSTQVRESSADDNVVAGMDMSAVLQRVGSKTIDLLKMDIERAEVQVFGSVLASTWLHHVKNIAIELHDQTCEAVFLNALEPFDYEAGRSFELMTCFNIRPKPLVAGSASHVTN
jgi:FkbM family methyltransferase